MRMKHKAPQLVYIILTFGFYRKYQNQNFLPWIIASLQNYQLILLFSICKKFIFRKNIIDNKKITSFQTAEKTNKLGRIYLLFGFGIYFLKIYVIMFSLNDLIQAFGKNSQFAWEILYSQILMETATISTDYLKKLVLLYSQGAQKSMKLQASLEHYFKNKINSLLGQKKVIQCLHDQNNHKQSHKPKGKQNFLPSRIEGDSKPRMSLNIDSALNTRRREIQMRLAYDIEESKTSRISKMLKQEGLRQEKYQKMVTHCIDQQQDKLRTKIMKRKERASISRRMTASLKLDLSAISTYGEGLDSSENLDSVLQGITFISSIDDPDL